VIINPVCSKANQIKCPDGQCKPEFTECEGSPDTGDLEDVSYVIANRDRNRSIRVNLVNRGNSGGLGAVEFPPNMLHPGWNITIRLSPQNQQQSSSSSGCGDDNVLTETASVAIEIQVTDSHGDPVRHFDNSFGLSLFGILRNIDDICLGYRSQYDEDWNCDDSGTKARSTNTRSVFVVESEFDHLTSFAVLLGGSNNRCGWGWIEFASMGMIGGAIVLTLVVMILHCCSYQFRALVAGADERKEMIKIEKAKERARTTQAPREPTRRQ